MRTAMLTALASVSSYTSGDLSSVAQVAGACNSVLTDPTLITPIATASALQVNIVIYILVPFSVTAFFRIYSATTVWATTVIMGTMDVQFCARFNYYLDIYNIYINMHIIL